jgi:predicted glutamine amidotransferase
MCRMVGVVFQDEFPIQTLRDLQHIAEVGRVPNEEKVGHEDGWGIASFMSGSPRLIGKSIRPIHMDPSFDSAILSIQSIFAPNVLIAHARAASRGTVSIENTHPFMTEDLIFAHNGTIYDFNPVTKRNPKGQTDSERLLMLLSERKDELGSLESALKAVVTKDLRSYRFSAAVILVSDGKSLYGYRGYTEPKNEWYYKLKLAKCDGALMLYQEVVNETSRLGEVSELKNGELVSIDLDLKVRREQLC